MSRRMRQASRHVSGFRWTQMVGALGVLGCLVLWPGQAQAAIITWDGGGADNNWNTVANWVGDVAPGTVDVATFDATSVKNAMSAGYLAAETR